MKRTLSLRLIFACCATFLAFLFLGQAHLYATKAEPTRKGRTDGIVIDLPAIPGGEQMPGVKFYHDLHTEQIKGKEKDCSVCHLKVEDSFVFKYKRTKDSDTKTDMDIYHDNCIACHTDIKAEGKKSGPLEAQCRQCHNTKADLPSTWSPISFDKSLHNRHETAKAITSPIGKDETNCSACHHGYDEKAGKLFYNKGEEDSCRYCHKSGEDADKSLEVAGKKSITLEKSSSMRDASHNGCVNCHLVEMKKFAGPVNCNGCHDLEAQKKIEKIQDVPRLKRNQPDVVMISAWDAEKVAPEEIAKVSEQHMNSVVFNHKNHERASKDCRSCHHDTLKNCKECHTVQGSEKGGFVKLEKAMHDSQSDQSCIGCHDLYKTSPDCAGCHAQMPGKSFAQADNRCNTCHAVDAKAINLAAMDKEAVKATAAKISQARVEGYKTVADDKIPEKVTIGHIVDKYEASEFPHAKIIKAIEKRVAKSDMAKVFHKDALTLCMGCHHNSPVTEKPQKCGTCHGKRDAVEGDGRPDLKGAYHGQCITCHQKMKVETVVATDCNKCHKEIKKP